MIPHIHGWFHELPGHEHHESVSLRLQKRIASSQVRKYHVLYDSTTLWSSHQTDRIYSLIDVEMT